jgi:hypothetical protein
MPDMRRSTAISSPFTEIHRKNSHGCTEHLIAIAILRRSQHPHQMCTTRFRGTALLPILRLAWSRTPTSSPITPNSSAEPRHRALPTPRDVHTNRITPRPRPTQTRNGPAEPQRSHPRRASTVPRNRNAATSALASTLPRDLNAPIRDPRVNGSAEPRNAPTPGTRVNGSAEPQCSRPRPSHQLFRGTAMHPTPAPRVSGSAEPQWTHPNSTPETVPRNHTVLNRETKTVPQNRRRSSPPPNPRQHSGVGRIRNGPTQL